MQGVAKALRVHGNRLKHAVLQHLNFTDGLGFPSILTRSDSANSTPRVPHKGLENITVSELLKSKGEDENQEVYCCRTCDGVYDAVQNVYSNSFNSVG